jgi:SAM-dependent methyltransferase
MPNIKYTSVDLSHPLAMLRADLTDLPLPEGAFDFVICSHVLEHVEDDGQAMREVLRVLRVGGSAILQVPIDYGRDVTFEDPKVTSPQDRLRVFGQEDHVRCYGRDYVSRLIEAGFDVRVDAFVRGMAPELVEYYRLDVAEEVFVCTKVGPSMRGVEDGMGHAVLD